MTAPRNDSPVRDQQAVAHAEDLGAFVMESPSSFHAVEAAARRLQAAGFTQLDETRTWSQRMIPGRHFVVRDGALIAWVTPHGARPGMPPTGFKVLGTHTDSPSFKLKPRPSTGAQGWWQAGVEVYGGPLLNSWLDRELRLAGRLTVRTPGGHSLAEAVPDDPQRGDPQQDLDQDLQPGGVPERGVGASAARTQTRLVATEPIARIPQLAIHLDRSANQGLSLDSQQHTQPIWGCGPAGGDLLEHLASRSDGAPVDREDILGWDVVLADGQEPRIFGANGEFLASGRLDNLSSVHAGVTAMVDHLDELEEASTITLLAAFDHEEVGSQTRSGAGGPFLEDILVRIGAGFGWSEDQRRAAWASSSCLSADAGHLVHPNYQAHHDPANKPVPGGGPLLKINANQRYTTDAEGAASWKLACAAAGVPTQEFVSNNTVPCGSTIGPITAARLGLRTVDVGVGLLSMHSAREMVHLEDLYALKLAVGQWWLT